MQAQVYISGSPAAQQACPCFPPVRLEDCVCVCV